MLFALARAAGVVAEVEASGPGTEELEVRRLGGEGFQFLWAFNHSGSTADAAISLRLPWPLGEARDVATGERVRFRGQHGKAVLAKHLAAGEVWTVRLGR